MLELLIIPMLTMAIGFTIFSKDAISQIVPGDGNTTPEAIVVDDPFGIVLKKEDPNNYEEKYETYRRNDGTGLRYDDPGCGPGCTCNSNVKYQKSKRDKGKHKGWYKEKRRKHKDYDD